MKKKPVITTKTPEPRRTEYMPLDEIKPALINPKDHDLGALHESVSAFGYVENITLDERTGRLVAGHGRIEALKKIKQEGLSAPNGIMNYNGSWMVPVTRGWASTSDAQARAYLLASNRQVELGGWNEAELAKEIEELGKLGALDGVGFTDDDLSELMAKLGPKSGLTDPDDVPDVEDTEVYVKAGDRWACGDHVVHCADNKSVRITDKVALCLTDPPYAVNYENLERTPGQSTRKDKGDTYRDPEDASEFLQWLFEWCPSDAMTMTFPVNKHFHKLADASRSWDLLYDCVWLKQHFAFIIGRRFQPKHEPVLFFRRKNTVTYFNVPSDVSTIFEYDAQRKNIEHPTIKPIGLWSALVGYRTRFGERVADPFLGSGTTMIACEQLGRKCYGIEISPQYCQVAIDRWQHFTGKKAEKIG